MEEKKDGRKEKRKKEGKKERDGGREGGKPCLKKKGLRNNLFKHEIPPFPNPVFCM